MKCVNTECAEQFFSHLLSFVHTFRNSSMLRAPFWLLLIVHQQNLKKECKINNSAPTNEQIKELPHLAKLRYFSCKRRCVSIRSKETMRRLESTFRRRLLGCWSAPKLNSRYDDGYRLKTQISNAKVKCKIASKKKARIERMPHTNDSTNRSATNFYHILMNYMCYICVPTMKSHS